MVLSDFDPNKCLFKSDFPIEARLATIATFGYNHIEGFTYEFRIY